MPSILNSIFAKSFAALLCGALLAFSQAPHNFWLLIFPCFSLFYIIYSSVEKKRAAFFVSFLFALGYFVAGLNWIGNALLVEGNDFKWVWPLAVIALPMGLALIYAALLTFTHALTNRRTLNGFFAFTIALVLAEFIRGYAFTGFPWNLFGYTWIDLPIAQLASIVGPFGLTWLTIFWGSVFGLFVLNKKHAISTALSSFLIFALAYGFGHYTLSNSPTEFDETVRFSVVQPNIEQVDKWNPEKRTENFLKHIVLSTFDQKAEKNIIVWPETSVPPSFLNSLGAQEKFNEITDKNTYLLTGGLSITPEIGSKKLDYHNGLFLVQGKKEPVKLYSKSHLVPFGEYIPFQKFIPLQPVTNFVGMQRGDGTQTIKLKDGPSFSPQICYEIIFPSAMTHPQDMRPDYILTITNDAWYGDSAGPKQHFTQARFRAIEQGLPVIRSANTGVSGVIDPMGRVIEMRDVMTGETDGTTINTSLPLKTPPTLYNKFGNALFLIFIILSTGWVVLKNVKSYKRPK